MTPAYCFIQYVVEPTSDTIGQFQKSLQPMRSMLAEQQFFGGPDPNYADIAIAATFVVSLGYPTPCLLTPRYMHVASQGSLVL